MKRMLFAFLSKATSDCVFCAARRWNVAQNTPE